MNCIELINVTKKFDKKIVLDKINYSFEQQKIFGIVGKNGCGKSVLFKLISGLMRATSGKIVVSGTEVCKNGTMPPNMGILIEHPGFLPDLTGFENLQQLAAIKNTVAIKDIDKILEVVSLFNDKNVKIKNYSLGMLQRLGIAQALMEKPQILLLDEPFNSMDQEGVTEMRVMLKNYDKENDATMLISSHNREDIDILTDKVITLIDGKLQHLAETALKSHN